MIIKGIIQEMTETSVKVNNLWIKFFDEKLINDINKGDNVEIVYSDKSKDNKIYHNGKSIKLTSEVKKEFNKTDNKNKESQALMILSYCKDIVIKLIEDGKIASGDDLNKYIRLTSNYLIENHKINLKQLQD